jgi:S-adenosylmethionine hydrolase
MPAPVITLLTDFGTADGYVAELKGVLTTHAAGVPLIDLSHDVPPQDVSFARLTVARYWRRFPVGTVHLVVVDPGVGTSRAAIAVESDGRFLVGPDNGVLSPALFALDARVIALDVPPQASPTFHGRDVFAPAAAQLALGAPLDSVGERQASAVRLRTPQPQRQRDGSLLGEVLTIDRFGNAITNFAVRLFADVEILGRRARMVRTYGDAEVGELVALIGSTGFVELAIRNGSAHTSLRLSRGMPVTLRS